MKPDTVVIYPSLGLGHLIPAVELGKLFLPHNIAVTIIILDPSVFTSTSAAAASPIDSFVSAVSLSHPQISFHRLPKPDPPSSAHTISMFFDHIARSNDLLGDFLSDLSRTSTVRALVLDMFCTCALDLARTLQIPAYFFFSSGVSCLLTFLTIPSLQSVHPNFQLLSDDEPLRIPGLPPIPASHIPDGMKKLDDEVNKIITSSFLQLLEADGIVVNSFEKLETRAFGAFCDMYDCPVYCIGPMVAEGHQIGEHRHECLSWLDEQLRGSVVFLCFGSMGSLSKEQVREVAVGLENSGHRFLWVVKAPVGEDPKKRFEEMWAEPELEVLLPEGFLERTKGRGMVVKAWAPQAEVLRHGSVGGFVTHCGWNSILEAVSCGVAMIAWPMYAEQRLNKVVLVEEMGLAVAMEGYDKEMVSGEEVERRVKWLMESEGGRELKQRAEAMRAAAVEAWEEGGSSERRWREFVGLVMSESG